MNSMGIIKNNIQLRQQRLTKIITSEMLQVYLTIIKKKITYKKLLYCINARIFDLIL